MMTYENAPYEQLCGCVVVFMSDTDNWRYDNMDKKHRDNFIKNLFRSKRDRCVAVDCEQCGGTGLVIPLKLNDK